VPIRRGVVYELLIEGSDTVGLLVLTNDRWNDSRMKGVGVVPVRRSEPGTSAHLHPVSLDSGRLQVLSTRLLHLEKEALGQALTVLDGTQMAEVEDALCDVLALGRLCGEFPEPPPTVPGRVDYPQWGEIYYAGDLIDGEYKRHVVVSGDAWNRESRTPILVRTTTQTRWSGDVFPPIENGLALACCAEARVVPATRVRTGPNARPSPRSLNRWDMAAVAGGLVLAYELHRALARLGVEIP
jgi:mRNA-degrading endonuclease toxin of MazEF toxin-antitoxin module